MEFHWIYLVDSGHTVQKILQTGLPARQHYPNIQVTFGLLIFVCTTTVFISISRPAMKKEKKRIWLHGQTALKVHGVNL